MAGFLLILIIHWFWRTWPSSFCGSYFWLLAPQRAQAKHGRERVQEMTVIQRPLACRVQAQFPVAKKASNRNTWELLLENASFNVFCIVHVLSTSDTRHHETSCWLANISTISEVIQALPQALLCVPVVDDGHCMHISCDSKSNNTIVSYLTVQEWFNQPTNNHHIWFVLLVGIINLEEFTMHRHYITGSIVTEACSLDSSV